MGRIGGLMLFLGIGSCVLYFMDREFTLLAWIDNWGTAVAWVIRAALILGGGGLWLKSRSAKPASAS